MSLLLDRFHLREVHLPLVEPFVTAHGRVERRRILLLEVSDSDGTVAWSECVAGEVPTYTAETVETAWLALESWLLPAVLRWPLGEPGEVTAVLDAEVRGHPMAKAAVEMAVWTLDAQRQGISLARRLGGSRPRVETGIALGFSDDPAALVERARREAARGYRKLKIKIAPDRDVEPLRCLRRALGDEVDLAVDANGSYRREDQDHLRRLEAFGLSMIEQPLPAEDLLGSARLQQALETPVCLDESVASPALARQALELGAGRIVNLKPGRVGGFAAALEIHDLCRAQDVPLWCGGMLESGIGRAYNVALASLPGFTLPGDLSPSKRYWAQDLVEPEWTMDPSGRVEVPLDRPGLGVEVDRDRIEALTVRRQSIRA